MTATPLPAHHESIFVDAAPDALYDLVSDVTRTGEWSPVCKACWWDDDAEVGEVGAWFNGRNETPTRTWETRSQVIAAERGREFAWKVGGSLVSWGFSMAPEGSGTRLTESWSYLPDGVAFFHETYGDQAEAQMADRTQQALAGIPETLAAIKAIAEGATAAR